MLIEVLTKVLKYLLVYAPALLFWIAVAICILANSGEKENKERHEADGK